MSTIAPLERRTTVDALVEALRTRILDGDLAPGARLVEQELSGTYAVARHTARAALRALQAEGLVTLEPHRGARVATLDPEAVRGLYELRAALEVEAVRLALLRHDGKLPPAVRAAVARLTLACGRSRPRWSAFVDAHDGVHAALVAASESPRIIAAHRALAGEMRLFLVQLKPAWTVGRLARDHEQLIDDLEARGAEALRDHLRESTAAVLALLGEG